MTPAPALLALARTTVAEAIRDRILYGLLVFALGMILLSAVLSSLTLGYPVRIVTDLCFSAISISGALMAILLGVGSVAREVERRVAYPILAKPVARGSYVLGKYLGVVATVYLNVLVMMAATTFMVWRYGTAGHFEYAPGAYALTLGLELLRLAVIAAVAVAFSTFTSSTVALIASVGMTVAGQFTSDLRGMLAASEDGTIRQLGTVLYHLVPDLSALEGLPRLLHGHPILPAGAGAAAAYGACFAAALLALAIGIFARRDLP